MQDQQQRMALASLISQDIVLFCSLGSRLKLRSYQAAVARAVIDSVIHEKGLSFVVIFPRQSGKNELQAQLEAYLLYLYSEKGAEMVKISPTWKPQSQNAMRRLEQALARNSLTRSLWSRELGYIYRLRQARITFLSGSPAANVVGATASLLLECDEAQSVLIDKWDRDINPMAASTNATRLFCGTAWSAHTLLGRERRLAEAAQREDGIQRLFLLDAVQVAAEVPRYGLHVQAELRKFGRSHPFIRTQYFSEEIDDQAGMFPPERQAAMRGSHAHQLQPRPGRLYAFLLDVGGEEPSCAAHPGQMELPLPDTVRAATAPAATAPAATAPAPRLPLAGREGSAWRDFSALTICEIDLGGLADEGLQAPVYRLVQRMQWRGTPHTRLYGALKALIETWQPRWVAIDATGVGAGLASFLEKAYPERLLRFLFSQSSKSQLGWDFLAVVETGRLQDWQADGDPLQELFWKQVEACEMEVLPGPERRLRWGVPGGRRDPQTGALVHDDLLVSAALCALLDRQAWGSAVSGIVAAPDPLEGMKPIY
jgi:hypothetical protein